MPVFQPPELLPEIYDYVLANIDPETMQKDVEVIAREADDTIKEALLYVLKNGLGLWSKQKDGAARLQSYIEATIPADLGLVLNPDFLHDREVLRKAQGDDKLLPLQVETLMEQRKEMEQQAQLASTQGIQPPPLPPELANLPPLWYLLAQLPDYVWREVSMDMGRLFRAQVRKSQPSA